MKKMKRQTKTKKTDPSAEVDPVHSPEPSTLSGETFQTAPRRPSESAGTESAGQSGDLQGLSRRETADSESVEELVAEGQYREAEIVSAIEDADDPDEGEVRTREVLQDDVPTEYTDED